MQIQLSGIVTGHTMYSVLKTDEDSLFHCSRRGLYNVENAVITIFLLHQQVADWVVAWMGKHWIMQVIRYSSR